ncbi:helix-turn-helix transcriptional regulator [Tomitella biformata]|uniref:helix-turn-helix transcriptional regulator n=1 Tax=Tomitella biformata TaxID=630403 RepID=UPI00046427A3|nr:ArsR family transcriptional regulator [Tomitella biformata]
MAATNRAKTHSALSSPSRVALINELRTAGGPLDAHQLSEICGLHVTTVRFHLEALITAGLVASTTAPSNGRGRPRLLYSSVSQMAQTSEEDSYLQLSRLMAQSWASNTGGTPAERAEQAGREWAKSSISESEAGQRPLVQVAAEVNAMFTEIGFEPELLDTADGIHFELHACPFGAIAAEHPEIVCNIHLGLLRGTIERLTRVGYQAKITPWATPTMCQAAVLPNESAESGSNGSGADPAAAS